jgi:hypothetical protein
MYKPIDIECPECGESDYMSFNELYDDEWISLQCDCLVCKSKFQINYRAVGIDIIGHDREEREIKREFRKKFLNLLERDHDLEIKYFAFINSNYDKLELSGILNYILNKYAHIFKNIRIPHGKYREDYLSDVIQFLCAVDA